MAQEPLSLWLLAPPLLAVHSHLQTPSFLVGCGRRSQLCLQRERFFWLIQQRLPRTKIFCPSTSVSCCCRVSCMGSRSSLHCFGLIVIYIFYFDHSRRYPISSPSSPSPSTTRACLLPSFLVGHTSSTHHSFFSIALTTTVCSSQHIPAFAKVDSLPSRYTSKVKLPRHTDIDQLD